MVTLNYAMDLQNVSVIKPPKGQIITGNAKLKAPSHEVWKVVGNFAGFATFITPLVWTEMTGSGVRSIRKKFFNDGNIVMEQLNSYDDKKMCMTWSLLYTTFNIGNLSACMYIHPITDSSCEVFWDILGEPRADNEDSRLEFNAFIRGFLDMAMSNLEVIFNSEK